MQSRIYLVYIYELFNKIHYRMSINTCIITLTHTHTRIRMYFLADYNIIKIADDTLTGDKN